jgi:cell division ATPase FtsA
MVREPIDFEREIDFENFLSLTMKSLEIVAGKICLAGLGVPDKIFCTLMSPWCAFQARTINFKKNTPFIFNEKLADGLTQKEIKIFEEESAVSSLNKNDLCLIELENVKTLLNGYLVSEPTGQKVKELEMTLFISIGSKQILKKIEEAISRHFHPGKMQYVSFTLASFSVVRDMFAYQDNFLLVDIGGEVTDISMVKKDILCSSVSFPIGINYFIRELASSLGCTLDEAKAYLSLYKDKHMVKSVGRKFEPVMVELEMDWLN